MGAAFWLTGGSGVCNSCGLTGSPAFLVRAISCASVVFGSVAFRIEDTEVLVFDDFSGALEGSCVWEWQPINAAQASRVAKIRIWRMTLLPKMGCGHSGESRFLSSVAHDSLLRHRNRASEILREGIPE